MLKANHNMNSFLRWLVLACYLIWVCQGQVKNLRPLKGKLNDFDGPRNATEERPPRPIPAFDRPPPPRPSFSRPARPPPPRPTSRPTRPPPPRPTSRPARPPPPRPTSRPARPPPPRPTSRPTRPRPTSRPTRPRPPTSQPSFSRPTHAPAAFFPPILADYRDEEFFTYDEEFFTYDEEGIEPIHLPENAHFAPIPTAVESDGAGVLSGGFAAIPSISESRGPPIEDSINEGVVVSLQQQQEQSSRPSKDLELSSKFLAAFRRAEKEAEEASCVGRALIETTKKHAERLELPFSEAVEILSMTEVDKKRCHEILEKEGCEDFKKPAPCLESDPYRRIDGSCNNLENPTWGRSMTPFVRFYYPAYENGIDSMRGEGRVGVRSLPSPRSVSYKLQSIRENPPLSHITLMVMQWGQFIDHDITFTAETQIKKVKRRSSRISTLTKLLTNPDQDALTCPSHEEGNQDTVPLECCPHGNPVDDFKLTDCRPIDVSHDPLFKAEGRSCMRFVRSLIASKGCELGPREQLNQITSYLDGSAVYGSTDKVSHVLRKGQGGHLHKTEKGDLLPKNCCEDRSLHCFKAGDTRVNEQPGLTSMHTLWLRVHEQLVSDFATENPHWDDETLFQEARRVVIALIQQTTYREFLPVVLGPKAMEEDDLHLLPNGPGRTYDATEDASIANVIATAAFRFGHTLVNDALRASGGEVVPLVGNFENAKVLYQNNTRPSAILEGLASSSSQAPDFYLVQTLTNKLFAPPEDRIGLDLMSLNIQRGRDHGLPAYTTWRSACDLPTFASFGELSTDMPSEVSQIFKEVYSDVDEIDLFPAALSEFPVDGGLVGPTFACLLGQQFNRLKKGDRFFFQNLMQPKPFTPDQLRSISKLTLASIICQHSDIESLQASAFHVAGFNGNDLQPCSSYPTLDTSLWKEKEMPPPEKMQCRGLGFFQSVKYFDNWCTATCFHNPLFCPPTHCSCERSS